MVQLLLFNMKRNLANQTLTFCFSFESFFCIKLLFRRIKVNLYDHSVLRFRFEIIF
jgi:hypothetical protein